MRTVSCLIAVCFLSMSAAAWPAGKDLGNGFLDHGVAAPVSCHRGTVATVDGNGRPVVLSWLMDQRGCYELLLVDAQTGKSEEYRVSFPLGDSPYASILSSANKFYTHFGGHFLETVYRRIFSEYIIADLRRRHCLVHGRGWAGDGIGSQIDNAHELMFLFVEFA